MAVATQSQLYTKRNGSVALGNVLGQGGEGAVYPLVGNGLLVAKVYHREKLNNELEDKVKAMASRPPKDPLWESQRLHSIAWAEDVLFADSNHKQFAGYLMPFIDVKVFREAHAYFDPEDRTRKFGGDFSWRYLFTAAQNLASCIAAIHAQKHRIGDLRERNVLIAENAFVCLVDCDSFQIYDSANNSYYPTRVGTGEYLPPELQGADFGKTPIDRYRSDLFALGVLIFKLLMQGVHPFQARGPLVEKAASTEAKITLGHFPYEGRRGVEPPAYAPDFNILPQGIRSLFRMCFVEGQRDPDKRPSAEEWFRELRQATAELQQCKANQNHWHVRGKQCPWCMTLSNGQPDPFPKPFKVGQQIPAMASAAANGGDPRKSFLSTYIEMALADGVLTPEEERQITALGLQHGLSEKDTGKLVAEALRKHPGARRAPTAQPAHSPPMNRVQAPPVPTPPAPPRTTPATPPLAVPIPPAPVRPVKVRDRAWYDRAAGITAVALIGSVWPAAGIGALLALGGPLRDGGTVLLRRLGSGPPVLTSANWGAGAVVVSLLAAIFLAPRLKPRAHRFALAVAAVFAIGAGIVALLLPGMRDSAWAGGLARVAQSSGDCAANEAAVYRLGNGLRQPVAVGPAPRCQLVTRLADRRAHVIWSKWIQRVRISRIHKFDTTLVVGGTWGGRTSSSGHTVGARLVVVGVGPLSGKELWRRTCAAPGDGAHAIRFANGSRTTSGYVRLRCAGEQVIRVQPRSGRLLGASSTSTKRAKAHAPVKHNKTASRSTRTSRAVTTPASRPNSGSSTVASHSSTQTGGLTGGSTKTTHQTGGLTGKSTPSSSGSSGGLSGTSSP
jgi:serine/threonine protein kinase